MTQQFEIPSHCATAVIFERAIMFIFEPIIVPFYYSCRKSDAEDFFVKHCLDCSLRAKACLKAGAINNTCLLNKRVQSENIVASIQMPIPRHIMMLYSEGYDPKFGYETADGIQPLRLGNISSGGRWCNGDVDYNDKSPSDVYNGYMQSIHNADLTDQDSTTYPYYLQEVAQDFTTKICKGCAINPEDWGAILDVVQNPTSILWSSSQSTDYYEQGYNYVKIQ